MGQAKVKLWQAAELDAWVVALMVASPLLEAAFLKDPSTRLLVPVFGVLSGVLMLGETLTLSTVIGGLLTVAGVGIIVLRRPRLLNARAGRI